MAKDEILYCSFCGKSQNDVALLIAGPSVLICDECVDLSAAVVLSHRAKKRDLIADALAQTEAHPS